MRALATSSCLLWLQAADPSATAIDIDAGCTVARQNFALATPGLAGFTYSPPNFEALGYHSQGCDLVHSSSGVRTVGGVNVLKIADSDKLCKVVFDQINIPGIYPGLQHLYLTFDLYLSSTRWENTDEVLVQLTVGVEDKVTTTLINTKGYDLDNYARSRFGLLEGQWVSFAYDLSGVTAAQLTIGLDSNSQVEYLEIRNVRFSTLPCKNHGVCVDRMLSPSKGYACECEGARNPVLTCPDFANATCCSAAVQPAFQTFATRNPPVQGVFQDRGGAYDFGDCSGNLTAMIYVASCGNDNEFRSRWNHPTPYVQPGTSRTADDGLAGNQSSTANYTVVDLSSNRSVESCLDLTASTHENPCGAVQLGTAASEDNCQDISGCTYTKGGVLLTPRQIAARTCGSYANATNCTGATVCTHRSNETAFYAACRLPVVGCMDSRASNFDPAAIFHVPEICSYRYLVMCASLCNDVYAACSTADPLIMGSFATNQSYCRHLLAAVKDPIFISDEVGCFGGYTPGTTVDTGHPGWEGMYCGYEVEEECASNPCLNGGTCHDGLQTYTCSCQIPYGLESLILDGDCDSRTGPIVAEAQFSEASAGAISFQPTAIQHELSFGNDGCMFSSDFGVTAQENFMIRSPLTLCSVKLGNVALDDFYFDPCPNGTLAPDGVNCTSIYSNNVTNATSMATVMNSTNSTANATYAAQSATVFNVQVNLFVPSSTWESTDYIQILADVGESKPVILFSTHGYDLDNCSAVAVACSKYVPTTSSIDPKTERETTFFWGSTWYCDAEKTVPTCINENAWCARHHAPVITSLFV